MLTLLFSLCCSPALAAEGPRTPAAEDTWDLSHVFADEAAWEAAIAKAEKGIKAVAKCEGELSDSARLLDCATRIDALSLQIARIETWASNHSSIDNRDADWRAKAQRPGLLWANLGEAISWFEPELQALGEKSLDKALRKQPGLEPFEYGLRSSMRRSLHTLPPEQEALLAATSTLRQGPGNIFGVLFNAEIPWPTVTLEDGSEAVLDTSAYGHHRASSSREERRLVFEAYYKTLASYQGTAGAALGSAAQGHWFKAKALGYESCLESALDHDFLPTEVYRTLIERTNANLPTLHRYLKLRARMMEIEDLGYHDLYPPLVHTDKVFDLELSKELTIESARIVGDDYTKVLEEGFANRWMHVYPGPGKSPGAYMDGGSTDVHPYVLLNHTDDYSSASTLAHEWGHAVHTALSAEAQPHATAEYATFIAEIASTFGEALLLDHMLKNTESDEDRLLYLGAALEKLRTTYFRQAMLSEFELAVHEMAERGEPITGEGLSATYLEIVRRYYGHAEGVTQIDELHGAEWVFIRHFYYNFYVWQYATSIAASSLLAEDVLANKDGAVERYLDLLRAGGSDDPYVLLTTAGVDMADAAPYDALARQMQTIMDEIEQILDRRVEEPADVDPVE